MFHTQILKQQKSCNCELFSFGILSVGSKVKEHMFSFFNRRLHIFMTWWYLRMIEFSFAVIQWILKFQIYSTNWVPIHSVNWSLRKRIYSVIYFYTSYSQNIKQENLWWWERKKEIKKEKALTEADVQKCDKRM
jgi:hypothetical protein